VVGVSLACSAAKLRGFAVSGDSRQLVDAVRCSALRSLCAVPVRFVFSLSVRQARAAGFERCGEFIFAITRSNVYFRACGRELQAKG
jgi:hypothetical protein